MLLSLTDLSSESLQSQIARQVRAKILNGDLKAEESLPSIRGLAAEHRVSVITVQRGYEHLEREGLIYSRRGKGFFVTPIHSEIKRQMAMQFFKESINPLIQNALEEGLSTDDILKTIHHILDSKE